LTEYVTHMPCDPVIVVVVDLYSASRSASNALIVPLRRKKMSFQSRSKAVGTQSRLPRRESGSEFHSIGPVTTKRAATVSWNHQLATVGRSKELTAWNVRCTRTAVHQVSRSLILQTPVKC